MFYTSRSIVASSLNKYYNVVRVKVSRMTYPPTLFYIIYIREDTNLSKR